MRQYLLYKTAGDEDKKADNKDAKPADKKSSNQRALLMALSTLGGGGIGYLLTRYGLGLKGAGAGILGAGLGATAGAGVGSYLTSQGKKKEEEFKKYYEELAAKKKLAERGMLGKARDAATNDVAKATAFIGAPLSGIYGATRAIGDLNKLEAEAAGKQALRNSVKDAPAPDVKVKPKAKQLPAIPFKTKAKAGGKGALQAILKTMLYGGAAAYGTEQAKSWAAGGLPEPPK